MVLLNNNLTIIVGCLTRIVAMRMHKFGIIHRVTILCILAIKFRIFQRHILAAVSAFSAL